MKYLLMITGLIIGANCWSQSSEMTKDKPVLYRGYTNKVVPSITDDTGKELALIGTNSKVKKVDGEDYFIVNLKGREKTETLHVVSYNGIKADTIESVEYRVANIPAPIACWGGLKSGGIGNITSKKLSFKYPTGVNLPCDYRIAGWELSANDKFAKGTGDDVSSAESFLKTIPSGTTLMFKFRVLSPDGITRLIAAQWEVKSWDEEVEMNPLRFDRE